MEIGAEKTKLTKNSASGIQREINVKGQNLGTVTSFKYLGAILSDEGSKREVSQELHKPLQLKPIWKDNNISLGSKLKLIPSLVTRFLYACNGH